MEIIGKSANDVFCQACTALMGQRQICDKLFETKPRGMSVKELLNVQLTVAQPLDNIVYNKHRKISLRYLVAELAWYFRAVQDKDGADIICNYATMWDKIRNTDGSLNSNYGHYCFKPSVIGKKNEGLISQFDYCIDKLTKDKDSRQAVININNIGHKSEFVKDFPCTVFLQFFIREEKLYMTANMRSCDLVYGFCNDVFQFTNIQRLLWTMLQQQYPKLQMGTFTLNAGSLHVYERHFKMIENVTKEDCKEMTIHPSMLTRFLEDDIELLLEYETCFRKNIQFDMGYLNLDNVSSVMMSYIYYLATNEFYESDYE